MTNPDQPKSLACPMTRDVTEVTMRRGKQEEEGGHYVTGGERGRKQQDTGDGGEEQEGDLDLSFGSEEVEEEQEEQEEVNSSWIMDPCGSVKT
ncbi:hypothetical protein EYF80_016181 [Liparis tanakae]|uniref:Uncharacterized protein n=1 Tax=Liparis tanakae TaxID=230148 RepID=A0A4Z2I6C2_9TELE|nr:hypothetical protein EYF80_016181 [Liparis tanakae]